MHSFTFHRLGRIVVAAGLIQLAAVVQAAGPTVAWPPATTQTKPHTYWWWMGSAVDTNNLSKELQRYHEAGMGGVHIIPIYGAKGWESNYISYLSPKWMEMMSYTVKEAKRRGMEVDMTTGTGWCFGGPEVTDDEANAVLVSKRWTVAAGQKLPGTVDRAKTQALMAFGPNVAKVDLLGKISAAGEVGWTAPSGDWSVCWVSQKPGPQKVKRAAPGGEGWMLNLAHPRAMTNFLRWMDTGLARYKGAKPRAQYHDSYEYKMDWSPVLFSQFEKRRGYRLQDHLDTFLSGEPAEVAARLKCDYRETISDIMVEETIPQWVAWSHKRGYITRNEAHGSPGNWLDLYAAADIPETEMFRLDRNKLISKFASSAAHVSGKNLVSAETGTWLSEHFTESLADMKYLLDDLFLSGVNHVFYHGTCYSPDEAAWPGWVFYASYEMNPRNAIWRDVGALNAYATRCQSVLQAGKPDNDILLYWPIHDFWSSPTGMVRNLTVHARDWFEAQPIGKLAEQLWAAGYQFDYISDRQLAQAKVDDGMINTRGGSYRVIVVPECGQISFAIMQKLVSLAEKGATIIFNNSLPKDVAGFGNLSERRAKFREYLQLAPTDTYNEGDSLVVARAFYIPETPIGKGRIQVGDVVHGLNRNGVRRETMSEWEGLFCLRRKLTDGRYYFIANRSDKAVDGWVPLAVRAKSVVIMDPLTAGIRPAESKVNEAGQTNIRLTLPAGASIILRTFDSRVPNIAPQPNLAPAAKPIWLAGLWQVRFLSGGPEMPATATMNLPGYWTTLADTNAQRFSGTAVYSLEFDAPAKLDASQSPWFELDLGKVAQSARVRLNGAALGTVFTPPYKVVANNLKVSGNVLEVEVTSTSANRIRDLDRRGVQWQNFYDINFVNQDYKKFNAADWPVADSGLLGPVTLTPLAPAAQSLP
jgi:hypothetical protein